MAEHCKIRPEDYVAINKLMKEVILSADQSCDPPTMAAWINFFKERERIFIPLLIEALGTGR